MPDVPLTTLHCPLALVNEPKNNNRWIKIAVLFSGMMWFRIVIVRDEMNDKIVLLEFEDRCFLPYTADIFI